MCGIIGIVSRPTGRAVPSRDEVLTGLDAAIGARGDNAIVAQHLRYVDELLRGDAGMQALAGNLELVAAMTTRLDALDVYATEEDRRVDALTGSPAHIEGEAALVAAVRDPLWSLRRDRLRTADAVHALAGRHASSGALCGYFSIQQAL